MKWKHKTLYFPAACYKFVNVEMLGTEFIMVEVSTCKENLILGKEIYSSVYRRDYLYLQNLTLQFTITLSSDLPKSCSLVGQSSVRHGTGRLVPCCVALFCGSWNGGSGSVSIFIVHSLGMFTGQTIYYIFMLLGVRIAGRVPEGEQQWNELIEWMSVEESWALCLCSCYWELYITCEKVLLVWKVELGVRNEGRVSEHKWCGSVKWMSVRERFGPSVFDDIGESWMWLVRRSCL